MDAAKVSGAAGHQVSTIFISLGAMAVGLGIALYYNWQLTLFTFAFMPPMTITQMFMISLFTGKVGDKEQKIMEEVGKVATEATIQIRTVADLGREDNFIEKYDSFCTTLTQGRKGRLALYGFLYGASLGIIFLMYAAVFWFTGWMVENDKMKAEDFENLFKVLFAVMFGAMTAGQASSMAPDLGEAKVSAAKVYKLLTTEPRIDPYSDGGKKPSSCSGKITLKDVEFHYPSRPDVKVLKGLSIDLNPGETLALVGQSGCGKSTCIQLIERFYDSNEGNILIDGHRISELNVSWVRKQIGLVQQEPVLFDKSIMENIIYGLDDEKSNTKDKNKVGELKFQKYQEDVENAAKEANAFDFIQELPSKFDTRCGKKGSQLSGGQKQRIAIARALMRNPKILLLDEATSALDTQSEKTVQDALNKAQAGRTCILVAHRLSTVINADKIAVIDSGKIVEIGTHTELINKKGAYYYLVNNQI